MMLPLCCSLPAGTRQTPTHLPYLGMHLGRGAGHTGDGTSPEQEEEEVGRLPVHGWVSQASGDFVCGEQWGVMAFRTLLWTQHCDGFGGLEATDSLQAIHGLLVGATGLTR